MAEVATQQIDGKRDAIGYISKTRFKEISQFIYETFNDPQKCESVMEKIKEVLRFDPNLSRYKGYSKQQGLSTKKYREKLKAMQNVDEIQTI
jgi:hypothetical protein